MVYKFRTHIYLLLFLTFMLIVSGLACASTPVLDLTTEEKQWLLDHSELKILVNVTPIPISFLGNPLESLRSMSPPPRPSIPMQPSNFGPPGGHIGSPVPLVVADPDQNYDFKGVAADYLKEIESLLGIKFKIVLLTNNNFEAMNQALLDGEADLLPAMIKSDDNHHGFVVSSAYVQVPTVIVTRNETPYIDDYTTLKTMNVAGTQSIYRKLALLGSDITFEHRNPHNGLREVATGKFDAFICELTSLSEVLSQTPLPNIKISGELPKPSDFGMAISKKSLGFLPIVNKALKVISSERKKEIWNTWFPIYYEQRWTASFWGKVGAAAVVILIVSISLLLWILNRHFNRVKNAVKALDPHLLSVNTDQNIVITQVTDAFCHAIGFNMKDLVGRPLLTLGKPSHNNESAIEQILNDLNSGRPWKGEVKLIKKDGSLLWTQATISPMRRKKDNQDGFTVIYQDVSQQKHFEQLATQDELTGLYNRRHFNELGPALMEKAAKEGKLFALMVMDIDFFKKYNDHYGHPAGDAALASIGKELKEIFRRSNDMVFRIGGEEFAASIIVPSHEDCRIIGDNLLSHIRNLAIPHTHSSTGTITLSVGIHIVDPADPVNIQDIYQSADTALYKAKENGRNQIVVTL